MARPEPSKLPLSASDTAPVSRGRWLPALHYPAYRLFWAGMLCLAGGIQVTMVSQLWLVHQLTGSPAYLGFVQFVSTFPLMVLSLLGGVLADRIDRGLFIIFSRSVIALVNLVMAALVLTGQVEIWQVVIAALVGAMVVSIEVPARMATYPTLVDGRDLPNAVTLNIAAWNITGIAGPAIAGPLVSLMGPGGGFALGAVLQATAVGFFTVLRSSHSTSAPDRDGAPEDSLWRSLVDGMRYLRGHAVLLPLFLLAIAPNALGSSYMALLPAFAADVLHGDAALYGSLLSAGGFGAAIATAYIALAGDLPRKGAIAAFAGVAIGVLLAVFAQMRVPLAALSAAAVLGVAQAAFMTLNSILIQSHVDDAYRGRVMSVLMMVWGFGAFGTLGLGALASSVGVPAALVLAAAIVAVSVLFVGARFRQLLRLS